MALCHAEKLLGVGSDSTAFRHSTPTFQGLPEPQSPDQEMGIISKDTIIFQFLFVASILFSYLMFMDRNGPLCFTQRFEGVGCAKTHPVGMWYRLGKIIGYFCA